MDDDLRQKTQSFLEWYRDLYGEEWYMDMPRHQAPQKNENLIAFHRQIENCTRCPLCETRTKFVFGAGDGHAEIMFIGEAPGRDEDLQGLPFVGRSGKLLTKILAEVQLNREDVFIANILKCRPPGNRDPKPEEVEKCIPYLHRQIELIKPRILVSLGRVSAQNLLNTKESLTRMRGKVWHYHNTPLIVTFHPAYILRNMSMLTEAVNDMKFVLQEKDRVNAS